MINKMAQQIKINETTVSNNKGETNSRTTGPHEDVHESNE